MPSGWRNKNTLVRYEKVKDPGDPSGKTMVKTEKGPSWFEVSTENLEYVPLDMDRYDTVAQISTELAHDGDDNVTPPMVIHATADYDAVHHQPHSIELIAQRRANAAPHEEDYIALSRQLPFNLGRALECIWLSVFGENAEQNASALLREARFSLADEMQRQS